jgi:hypothetical protein
MDCSGCKIGVIAVATIDLKRVGVLICLIYGHGNLCDV